MNSPYSHIMRKFNNTTEYKFHRALSSVYRLSEAKQPNVNIFVQNFEVGYPKKFQSVIIN